jgi:hypothetical protein
VWDNRQDECRGDYTVDMSFIWTNAQGVCAAAAAILLAASPAFAQRFTFQRSFEKAAPTVLDVITERGAIEIHAGTADRIVVSGTVTVRPGVTTPPNAMDLARALASSPPVQREQSTLKLRPPPTDAERRAVTVSYVVEVPPGTSVTTRTDSGATTIGGVGGAIAITTESAAIHLSQLAGTVIVTTGSGAIDATQVTGTMVVRTGSSAFKGQALGGSLTLQSQSGAVDAAFTGDASVDVQTGSSSVRLANVRGPLRAASQSGRLIVSGTPKGAWELTSGSGSMEMMLGRADGVTLDLTSGSGSVSLQGVTVDGSVSKKRVTGTVHGGGAMLRAVSRSGSLLLRTPPTR